MRIVLAIVLAAVLSGCATVEVSTPEMSIKTTSLFKNIEGASAQTDEMVLELNRSSSEKDSAIMLVCTLAPTSPICNE